MYKKLEGVLHLAFLQASEGKGKDRHANDRPFEEQPLMQISREVGPGGPAFQATKKIYESIGMSKRGELTAARHEILGAIVYLSALYILYEEMKPKSHEQSE